MGKRFSFDSGTINDILNSDIDSNGVPASVPLEKFPKYQLVEIPTSRIDIGSNIRNIDANDELELAELGASILEHGQIEPCIVYENGDRYTIKVGSRRFKACLECDIPTVKCIVEDSFKDEVDRIVKQAIENEHRKDMSPREREKYMATLLSMGLTQNEIAKALHKGKSWVSEALRAHDIIESNRDLFSDLAYEPSTRDIYNSGTISRELLKKVIENSKDAEDSKLAFKQNLKRVIDVQKDAQSNGYTEEQINEKLGFNTPTHQTSKTKKVKFLMDDHEMCIKICKKDIKDELDKILYAGTTNFYAAKGYHIEEI